MIKKRTGLNDSQFYNTVYTTSTFWVKSSLKIKKYIFIENVSFTVTKPVTSHKPLHVSNVTAIWLKIQQFQSVL